MAHEPALQARIEAPAEERALTPDEFTAAVAAVTNAFGDPTRREIYLAVRDAPDGVTTADVAERFALHPNVARHHLEKLAGALDALGPGPAEALADQVGYDYGRDLARRMDPGAGHRSVRTAIAAVADALTAHGFAARAETDGDAFTIVSECCPFGDAATRYPHVVCALDRGMIRGMLAGLYGETSPHFEASRPDGSDHCVARV